MTGDQEQRIRERAYQIWQLAGQPHGYDRQHWEQALSEIEAEGSGAGDTSAALPPADEAQAASTKSPRRPRKSPAAKPSAAT